MSKDLVKKDDVISFPALVEAKLLTAIEANLAEEHFSIFDLQMIKIPRLGVNWTYVNAEGEEITTDKLFGIILHTQACRGYYEKEFSPGTTDPPNCFSEDAIRGNGVMGKGSEGNPSGLCNDCPYSKFGTHRSSRGQACAERRRVFLLMPDSLLPRWVSVSPANIIWVKDYKLRCGQRGAIFNQVVTRLTLTPAKTKGQMDYTKIVFAAVGDLSAEQVAAAQTIWKVVEAALKKAEPTAAEFSD